MFGVTTVRTLLESLEKKVHLKIHVPWVVATSCCKHEIENVFSATYDWERLGVLQTAREVHDADLLLVAGWVNESLMSKIKDVHAQMSMPKSVIVIGACAISGAPYAMSGEKIIKVSDFLPVDVYVPGCPPRPDALLDAVQKLKEKLQPNVRQDKIIYEALKGPR